MQLASLGSGSKGNATIIQCGETRVLIDCGFTLPQFQSRLHKLELAAEDIDAILVTHEHADHAAGVQRLAHKFSIPIYTTVGTARALDLGRFEVICGGQQIHVGKDLNVQAVTVPHDAAEPVQFVFTCRHSQRRAGVLTDSGHVTSHMLEAYRDLHALVLEFNYDHDMLMNGSYPPGLKQRIAGGFGHLSNLQSISMLESINTAQLDCLVAAHLSENNNSPDIVGTLLAEQALPCTPQVACQQEGFAWIEM